MNVKIYSMLDTAAQAFTTPFFMHNDGTAIRAFQDNINSKDENNIKLHPEQFTLYRIGEWDDKTATIKTEENPKKIAMGIELINDNEPRYANTDLEDMLTQIKRLTDETLKAKLELQVILNELEKGNDK